MATTMTNTATKPKTLEAKLYTMDAAYIAPMSCDSMISYKIIRSEYGGFGGTIELADCGRKITWDFDNTSEGVDKIDTVITMLSEFRREFVKAQKLHNKEKDAITPIPK